jgi:signal peptidase I
MPESTDEPETVATGWNVTQNNETWSAEFKQASDSERPNSVGQQDWLRYYHYTLKPWQWYEIEKDGKLSSKVLPRSAQLISDFTHYNANLSVNQDFDNVGAPDKFGDYRMERVPFGLMITRNQMLLRKYLGTDGMNWVGDLASEFDLQLSSDKGTLAFDLVEAGVHYMLQIDAASGDAQLQAIENGQALKVFGAQGQTPVDKITASTSVRGNSSVSIKYANVDDTLHLWVNGSYIEFKPTNFSVAGKLANNGQHRPQFSEADSADAAPIGIAMSNGMTGKIARAKVWRDIYYTAVNDTHAIYSCDYFPDILSNYVGQEQIEAFQVNLPRDASPKSLREYRQGGDMAYRRDIFFGDPRLWANSDFFGFRRSVEFQLGKDQYFPMGDNSIESNDGRMWKQHFVERDLLIGRAALVFWPHPWNSPIPFMPNFRRMGIIR